MSDQSRDLVGDYKTYILFWGLPVAAMIGAIWATHPTKTLVWVTALSWMGIACLVNARHCGRIHCFYTGPFFLFMTMPVFLHGYQMLWLGPEDWNWLGVTVGVGGGSLWYLTENW